MPRDVRHLRLVDHHENVDDSRYPNLSPKQLEARHHAPVEVPQEV